MPQVPSRGQKAWLILNKAAKLSLALGMLVALIHLHVSAKLLILGGALLWFLGRFRRR